MGGSNLDTNDEKEIIIKAGNIADITLEVRANIAADLLIGRGNVMDLVRKIVAIAVHTTPEDIEFSQINAGKYNLAPEVVEKLFSTLEARFNSNMHLHPDASWHIVRKALEAAPPKVLWSVNQMEEKGHEPDIQNTNNKGFDIGTCSLETPESSRDCVYREKGLKSFEYSRSNGGAEEMAKKMGLKLMDSSRHGKLVFKSEKKVKFDQEDSVWLETDESSLEGREAAQCYEGRQRIQAIQERRIEKHSPKVGWRGYITVPWAA